MSIEANKTLVRRWYDQVWNDGGLDAIETIVGAGWTNHTPALEALSGVEGARRLVSMYRAAFPDLSVDLADTWVTFDSHGLRQQLAARG